MNEGKKFRAWSKNNQKFEYFTVPLEQKGALQIMVHIMEFTEGVPDDEWTISQFIGLVDKDGTDVYEGDLLDFDEKVWGGEFVPEAVPSIEGLWTTDLQLCGVPSDVGQFRKVVGSIFEEAAKCQKES